MISTGCASLYEESARVWPRARGRALRVCDREAWRGRPRSSATRTRAALLEANSPGAALAIGERGDSSWLCRARHVGRRRSGTARLRKRSASAASWRCARRRRPLPLRSDPSSRSTPRGRALEAGDPARGARVLVESGRVDERRTLEDSRAARRRHLRWLEQARGCSARKSRSQLDSAVPRRQGGWTGAAIEPCAPSRISCMTSMRSDLPSGTVTFLFTDVEGSTKLLHELGRGGVRRRARRAPPRDPRGLRRQGGVEVDTQGDAFFFAFPTAPGALAAAEAMTEALATGPIQVRIGLHTGTPLLDRRGLHRRRRPLRRARRRVRPRRPGDALREPPPSSSSSS